MKYTQASSQVPSREVGALDVVSVRNIVLALVMLRPPSILGGPGYHVRRTGEPQFLRRSDHNHPVKDLDLGFAKSRYIHGGQF